MNIKRLMGLLVFGAILVLFNGNAWADMKKDRAPHGGQVYRGAPQHPGHQDRPGGYHNHPPCARPNSPVYSRLPRHGNAHRPPGHAYAHRRPNPPHRYPEYHHYRAATPVNAFLFSAGIHHPGAILNVVIGNR